MLTNKIGKSLFIFLLIIVFSTSNVFAANISDVDDTIYQDAVHYLIDNGIMSGYPDGEFKPNNDITRAEMAATIVRAIGINFVDIEEKSNFNDMAGHWADKYVSVAFKKNIVTGYTDGTFRPDSKVTFPEAITLVVKMAGLSSEVSTTRGWPTNYINYAHEKGILRNVEVVLSETATRGDVAIMLYNAFNILNSYDNIGVAKATVNTFISDGINTKDIKSENDFANNLNYFIGVETTLDYPSLSESTNVPINYLIYKNNNLVYQITKTVALNKNTASATFYSHLPIDEFINKEDGQYRIDIISNQNLIKSKKIDLYTDYSYEVGIIEGIEAKSLKFFASNGDYIEEKQRIYTNEIPRTYQTKCIWWELEVLYPDLDRNIEFPIHYKYIKKSNGFAYGDHTVDYFLYLDKNLDKFIGGIYSEKFIEWPTGTYKVQVYSYDKLIAEGDFKIVED